MLSGVNYFTPIASAQSQAAVQQTLDQMLTDGINCFRPWVFDHFFRFLEYTAGTNLLANGTLEANGLGWTYGSGFSRSSANAHSGTWSIRQQTANGYALVKSDPITVTPNTWYMWEYWYNGTTVVNPGAGAFEPRSMVRGNGNVEVLNGGFNYNTNGLWQRKQVQFNSGANTIVTLEYQNWGGAATMHYDDINLSLRSVPTVEVNETAMQRLDRLVYEADQRGLIIQMSLADNNPTYNSKPKLLSWVDQVHGTSYASASQNYFDQPLARQMQQDFYSLIINRVNTVTGIPYLDYTNIIYELGNELRYDLSSSEGGTQHTINSTNVAALTDWVDEQTTYIRGLDPNHLITFGDMAHTWQWVDGDWVSNGTSYGVDYAILLALPNVNFGAFHTYPFQGSGGQFMYVYGIRLGLQGKLTLSSLVRSGNVATGTTSTPHGWTTGDLVQIHGSTGANRFTTSAAQPSVGPITVTGSTTFTYASVGVDETAGGGSKKALRITGQGYRRQLQDFVRACKAAGKPGIIEEIGIDKVTLNANTPYPTVPRSQFYRQVYRDWYGAGGDGIYEWHYDSGNNYGLKSPTTDVAGTNPNNDDDAAWRSLKRQWHYQLNNPNGRIPLDAVTDIST